MIVAVVLAAGMSMRMGENKLLLPFKGKTVIENVVRALLSSKVDQVAVVCGHEGEKIKKILENYPVSFIDNPLYASGQSTSIVKSVETVGGFAKGILFVMADQPLITAKAINQIIQCKPTGIVVPVDGQTGRKGAPVLFGARFFEALRCLEGDVGGRRILEKHPEDVTLVPIDSAYFFEDVDTVEAYENMVFYVGEDDEKNDT